MILNKADNKTTHSRKDGNTAMKKHRLLAASLAACLSLFTCMQTVHAAAADSLYRSELTNEWITASIQTQRPVAIIVDNEKIALPHYGLSTSDVVYEITNSLKNDGVTRFMVLKKDWTKITQFGSIRSVRPTNLQLAPEWNAVVCHDGGPFYIKPYLANPYVDNFSGGFTRINNGKAREFTEYVTGNDLIQRFNSNKCSTQYNAYYPGPHYLFAPDDAPNTLATAPGAVGCSRINLPYKHNKPNLTYNAQTGLYYYAEYGKAHVDPGNNNAQLSFKNLLIQNTTYTPLDANGYLVFNTIGAGTGYYITNGKAIPITWSKASDTDPTRYYDANGSQILLNTGRTYVAIVPSDLWAGILIQ